MDHRETPIELLRPPRPAPYTEVWDAQRARRDAIEAGEAPEALFLVEHAPVFTLGRNADESHLLQSRDALAQRGIDVVEVDRGGDITYHGPGQFVAYPILHLGHRNLGIRQYLRLLEQAAVDTLGVFAVHGERLEGYTGVWVDGAKVAAIGVAVHRNVSLHGVAINVDPNMEHWQLIVPCGIPDKPVTSLRRILGEAPPLNHVEDAFTAAFSRLLTAPASTPPQ